MLAAGLRLPTGSRRTRTRLSDPPRSVPAMADGWTDITPAGDDPWESLVPGPQLAQALAYVDPATLPESARVAYLKATSRLVGWAHMRQACALVAVADAVESATAPGPGMVSSHQASWVADEVAAALHVAARTATVKVNDATALLRDWPALGAEVTVGRLTPAQARVIYEGVSVLSGHLDDAGVDLSERAVQGLIRIAPKLPPARLRERVARVVASLDPEAAMRRRQRAERDLTDVSIWAEADGMACLAARGQAIDLVAMREIIDARAALMRDGAAADDERTAGQWRLAAMLAAFGVTPVGRTPTPVPTSVSDTRACSDPVGTHGRPVPPDSSLPPHHTPVVDPVRVQIRVTVPLDTLFGLSETPGELEGYGPLDPALVRALAADADWIRWVTDDVTGVLLDEGDRRFPGARLARFLRARESHCKHPSCGVRSSRADADHLPPHSEGGRTSARTMSPTCPRHNRGREESRWQAREEGPRDPQGPPDPVWTSPLRRRYQTATPQVLAHDFIPRRM